MRVIAGTFRSRSLQAPRGTATRPTSDRLRETLFNVIAARVSGSRFADLYAGSGAVGIEAISRGAVRVLFAEKDAAALAAIRANLQALAIVFGTEVESGGTAALLKRMQTGSLDVVFLDPPYEEADEYRRTLTALGSAASPLVLAGLVVAEHSRKIHLLDRYGLLARTRTLLQGEAALSFYEVRESES